MRPKLRPTCGRRNAADYERHNAFQVFITNAADARPTLRPWGPLPIEFGPPPILNPWRTPWLRPTMNRPLMMQGAAVCVQFVIKSSDACLVFDICSVLVECDSTSVPSRIWPTVIFAYSAPLGQACNGYTVHRAVQTVGPGPKFGPLTYFLGPLGLKYMHWIWAFGP